MDILVLIILIILILFIILICLKVKLYENFVVSNKPPFPIDIVYTWAGEDMSDDIRLSNNNELKYSIRSVYKYAPWINRIYILMNPPKKVPSWFNNKYSKLITIVDHKDTFPNNSIMPNTNSNAIETTLHNISGLSEHFIYFNDDFFLGDYVKYTDFFTSTGKPIVHNDLKKIINSSSLSYKKESLKIEYPKILETNALNFYPHVPIPLLKSYIFKFQNTYPKYINWIRSYNKRLREGCDLCCKYNLSCPCQQSIQYVLFQYLYDRNMVKLSNIKETYFNSDNIDKLSQLKRNPPKFFCINDTAVGKVLRSNIRNKMDNFLNSYYKEIPFFEKI